MKVLLLHRQPFGGLANYVTSLAGGLAKHDVKATVLDATRLIPNETGAKPDKTVSAWLKDTASGFDLVHAFGYRPAWACAEAFGYDEAWVYTAFDMPKTTHSMLIDRLNRSQAGICASNAILRELDKALALDLSVVYPGVETERDAAPTRDEAREALGLPKEALMVGAMGRWEIESGFRSLIDSMCQVTAEHGTAHLAIAGAGVEEGELRHRAEGLPEPECVHFMGTLGDPRTFLAALDLLVVPCTRGGASMAAIEAMAESVPVLLRNVGGLSELILEDVSGYLFDSDEQLGTRIAEMLSMPLTLESTGRAGRLRVMERFTLEQSARSVVELYQSVTQDLFP